MVSETTGNRIDTGIPEQYEDIATSSRIDRGKYTYGNKPIAY